MKTLDQIEKDLFREVADINEIPTGAYNFRINGKAVGRQSSANINVESQKGGLKITVKPNTKDDVVHIPVIITKTGFTETVINDFYIGDNADVTIVEGCGIYNCGASRSEHNGVHTFHIGKNAKVKYIEKHYGAGPSTGKWINPTTKVYLEENSYAELELEQIRGVDSTDRVTEAELKDGAKVLIHEKMLTQNKQYAKSHIEALLLGKNSVADIVSRSVATDESRQEFTLHIEGDNECRGHSECDAILQDKGSVIATPSLDAKHVDAQLVHEAAIGKIAGEQLNKLMSLGLTQLQAESQIVNGFLK